LVETLCGATKSDQLVLLVERDEAHPVLNRISDDKRVMETDAVNMAWRKKALM